MEQSQAKLKDFKVKKLIGKGTYCQVYLVKHRAQDMHYALKSMKLLEATS